MHPVISIASFLVIAISLAQINQAKLLTAAFLMLLLFFMQPSFHSIQKVYKLIFRLRWLFLSIFIVYAWFTPGRLLIPGWGGFSPYQEGTVMGLMRISALIMILSAVCLLVLNQSRNELISAIYWYCQPLKWLGVPRERLAVRLVLTMDSVKQLESSWIKSAGVQDKKNTAIQNRYQRVLQLFKEVVNSAETDELKTLSISLLAAPVWYQWFIPLTVAFIFLMFN